MKLLNKAEYMQLIQQVSDNIIINDLNSQSYVSKILMNDYLNSLRNETDEQQEKKLIKEINRLLLNFNLEFKGRVIL